MSSFFHFLIRMGAVTSNPCDALERPKVSPAPPRGLSAEQVRRLLAVIPETPAGLRDRAIFLMLVLTGRRRSEVLNLRVGDLSFEEETVFYQYRGKGGKRGRRELPRPAYQAIVASGEVAEGACRYITQRLYSRSGLGAPGGRCRAVPSEPTVRARDLTSMLDLSPEELAGVLDLALGIKRDGSGPSLAGQTLALVFQKPSLRTRTSFEVAMRRLGGSALYLSPDEVQLGKRELAKDVARVLSRMVQAIAARTFAQTTIDDLARYADIPVINALSDDEHPCQALADLLTLRERFGSLRGVRLAYVGDGNNVARSLAYGCVMAGVDLVIAAPAGYELPAGTIARARALGGGGSVTQVHDPHEGVRGAAAVYTDVWASMGQEGEAELRREVFAAFQVNAALLASAPPDALVMHDLPAHRGEEITDEAIESQRSVVFDQVENRVHAQQAVLATILGGGAR